MNEECIKLERELQGYNILKAQIRELEIRIEEIKDEYFGISEIVISEKTGPTNKISSPVESEVLKKETAIKKLELKIRNKKRSLQRMDNAMIQLNDDDKLFVELKYIFSKTNKELAVKFDCSPDYITIKRRGILSKLDKINQLLNVYN